MDTLHDQKKLLYLSVAGNVVLLGTLFLRELLRKRRGEPNGRGTKSTSRNNGETNYGKEDGLDPILGLKKVESHDPLSEPTSKQNYSKDIYTICLTGGPCAGKTTALAEINMHLRKFGVEVFCVPETATLTMLGGGNIMVRDFPTKLAIRREVQIIRFQQILENYFKDLANIKKQTFPNKIVVICDRGCMDARAYLPDELWQAILDQMNWNPIVLSNKRYDMVVHLVTSADGASQFYTTENNQARYETAEEATILDGKLQSAYNGHPHHKIIRNVPLKDFHYKMTRTIEEIMTCIELTAGTSDLGSFRYLLSNDISKIVLAKEVSTETVDIEEVVLKPVTDEEGNTLYRLLSRQTRSSAIDYYLSTSIYNLEKKTRRFIQMKKISVAKHLEYLGEKSPDYHVCSIKKTSFIWKKRTFSLETDRLGDKVYYFLAVGRGKDDKYEDVDLLPEFIQPFIKEIITDTQQYEFIYLYKK